VFLVSLVVTSGLIFACLLVDYSFILLCTLELGYYWFGLFVTPRSLLTFMINTK
jgi:hypothetical protein